MALRRDRPHQHARVSTLFRRRLIQASTRGPDWVARRSCCRDTDRATDLPAFFGPAITGERRRLDRLRPLIDAQMMRRILIDHARARVAAKRGGARQRLTLSEVEGWRPVAYDEDLLALDQALSQLERLDPRAAPVVELRFFAGLQETEIADVLRVSVITVKRDWESRPCVAAPAAAGARVTLSATLTTRPRHRRRSASTDLSR